MLSKTFPAPDVDDRVVIAFQSVYVVDYIYLLMRGELSLHL